MAAVTAFVSGKGGTGKTTLCGAIAGCLAAEGRRVLCLDLDIGLRNLDLILGLAEEPILPFTEVAKGHQSPDAATQHPGIPGLYLLTAPLRARPEDIDPAEFDALIRAAEDSFDDILIDAPAGIGTGFDLGVRTADRVLLVCAADPASLRDAEQTARLLELQGKDETYLVVNRVQPGYFRAAKTTVDDMMDTIGIPLLGLVPDDKKVPIAAARNRALVLHEQKGAAAACLRISRRLLGRKVPLGIK
ncbi:MAG: septum site-determining protein MinD [Ruminococcaceae bacterium]|nr:septum site-determining protein MinD [Oscillospiraceae bacterium]